MEIREGLPGVRSSRNMYYNNVPATVLLMAILMTRKTMRAEA